MKLSESQLRSIIREELMKEMKFFDKEDIEDIKPKSMKDIGIMGLMSTIIASPMLLRQFLLAHPDMMQQLQDFVSTHLMKEEVSGVGVGSALGQPVTPIRQVISKLTDLMRKVESPEVQYELSDIINDLGNISKGR